MRNYVLVFFWLFMILVNVTMKGQRLDSAYVATTKISLLTCDPGDELYSTFGHSAIRVFNTDQKVDDVFNYGTFNFKTPNFAFKFMKGLLPYQLSVSDYASFLQEYHYYKRGVKEQVLSLDHQEKVDMIKFLINNAKPENSQYKYDFFYDNCSTRIRDVFEKTSGPLTFGSATPITFRQMLHQFLVDKPWTKFGIDLIIGSKADKQADVRQQMFLPEYLHQILAKTTKKDGKLLAEPSYQVLTFEDELQRRKTTPWFTPLMTFSVLSILLGLIYFLRQHKLFTILRSIYFLILGLAGLLMLIMWFLTEHQATKLNWNILWASPLFLILPFLKGKNKEYLVYFLLAGCAVSLVDCFVDFIPQQMPFLPLAIMTIASLLTVKIDENRKNARKKISI